MTFFADEKLMKEIELVGAVRRTFFTREIPNHSMSANSRNRYNILTVVTFQK